VKATRIQEKVAGVGFEWKKIEQVWDKVEEELAELKIEIKNGDQKRIESEFGDVLFALINYARFLDVSPENALESTNKKFINRFQHMEKEILRAGREMNTLSLDVLETYWAVAKKIFI
jgi:XTP/dITP diphosphohydrolase